MESGPFGASCFRQEFGDRLSFCSLGITSNLLAEGWCLGCADTFVGGLLWHGGGNSVYGDPIRSKTILLGVVRDCLQYRINREQLTNVCDFLYCRDWICHNYEDFEA